MLQNLAKFVNVRMGKLGKIAIRGETCQIFIREPDPVVMMLSKCRVE